MPLQHSLPVLQSWPTVLQLLGVGVGVPLPGVAVAGTLPGMSKSPPQPGCSVVSSPNVIIATNSKNRSAPPAW